MIAISMMSPIPMPFDLSPALGAVLTVTLLAVLFTSALAIIRDALSFGRVVIATGSRVSTLRVVSVPGVAATQPKNPPLAA